MNRLLLIAFFLSFNVFAAPVNVNTADAEVIAGSLNDIGKKKAENIVSYRQKHGPFKTFSDLESVKGIGKKTIEKNKKDILFK